MLGPDWLPAYSPSRPMGCNLWTIGYLASHMGLALPRNEAPRWPACGVRSFSLFLPSLAAAERAESAGELGGRRKGIGACRQERARVTAEFAPSPLVLSYIWSLLPLFSTQQPLSAVQVKFFLPLFFIFAQFVESQLLPVLISSLMFLVCNRLSCIDPRS